MRLFLLLCVVVAVVSGRPQELASEDEVELITPVANDEAILDGEKDPVVLVLRLPGFGGGDRDGGQGGQGFPGFSGFPGLGSAGDFPFTGLLGGNNRPKIPQIPQDPFNLFDDIFSGVANIPRDDVVEDGEVELIDPVDTNTPMRPGCGLLCTMFGIFEGLQDEIDVISDEIHGGGNGDGPFGGNGGVFGGNGGMFGGNGGHDGMVGGHGGNGGIFSGFPGIPGLPGYPEQEYDVNNSTYEEKVLEDGTKVAINKTVFADTDDNGNTFFVQTTFTQNVNTKLPALPPTQEADQEPVLPVEDFDEDVDNVDYDADSNVDDADYEEADRNEYDAVNNADDADYKTVDEASIELPNEDPTINEIDDGIDQGLKE